MQHNMIYIMVENSLDDGVPSCHTSPSQDSRKHLKCRAKSVTTDLYYEISLKYYVTFSVSIIDAVSFLSQTLIV